MDGIPDFLGCWWLGRGWTEQQVEAGRPEAEAVPENRREAGAAELGSEQLLVLCVLKTEPKGSALGWMWWDRGVSSDGLGLNS